MDGYLTKPIEVERLRNMLSKFGLAQNEAAAPVPAAAPFAAAKAAAASKCGPPVDLSAFQKITDGDPVFARELIVTFMASVGQTLTEIGSAIAVANRVELAKATHKLKGAAANIHAHELQSLAEQMESESAAGDAGALQRCESLLRQEFERVRQFLSDDSVVPQPSKAAS